MGRPPNPYRSVKITISANEQILSLLDELVTSGTFGKSRAEAIERLMSSYIRDAVGQVRSVPVKADKKT
jgi:Arc/MetJ-type ribon-helix-helix transcriptional regulator